MSHPLCSDCREEKTDAHKNTVHVNNGFDFASYASDHLNSPDHVICDQSNDTEGVRSENENIYILLSGH